MRPVVCQVRAKMFVAISVFLLMGIGLLFVHFHFRLLPRFFSNTFPHIVGWTIITLSAIGVLAVKGIKIDERGIHVNNILGITKIYGFHEIVHISAKMNQAPLTISARLNGEQRHSITIVPNGGRMRITISSTAVTNFMELYNMLLHTYQTRMEVIDKRGNI